MGASVRPQGACRPSAPPLTIAWMHQAIPDAPIVPPDWQGRFCAPRCGLAAISTLRSALQPVPIVVELSTHATSGGTQWNAGSNGGGIRVQ